MGNPKQTRIHLENRRREMVENQILQSEEMCMCLIL